MEETNSNNHFQRCSKFLSRNNHYMAVVFMQIVYAGMSLFSKAAITKGMNPYVFVVYRQAFASAALAPFAYYTERSNPAKLTLPILCKLFVSSLFGITMCLILYYVALDYVSATFATAINNIVPPLTFLLAVCTKMEKLSFKNKIGPVKLLGSIIGLSGAIILTFVKGPTAINPGNEGHISDLPARVYTHSDWVKGALILTLSNLLWTVWLLTQGPISKQYPAKLRTTALQCFFSSIQSAIWTVSYERNNASWRLGWNVNLVSVLYCGVVVTGINYWLTVWVVAKKGPVFPNLFNPISLMVTAACSIIFFKEVLHWGSLCGMVLLMVGLYAILWGKNTEAKMSKEQTTKTIEDEIKSNEQQKTADAQGGVELNNISYK
ncbi:hypothetical protein LIER_15899 [Lithospermum erythrorhizon]|uniref:WAT1-related protein n=1 Tax=Lithospermum erythrorhizon TaxID=34254 RepID=A0AAV3Q4M6_LITER